MFSSKVKLQKSDLLDSYSLFKYGMHVLSALWKCRRLRGTDSRAALRAPRDDRARLCFGGWRCCRIVTGHSKEPCCSPKTKLYIQLKLTWCGLLGREHRVSGAKDIFFNDRFCCYLLWNNNGANMKKKETRHTIYWKRAKCKSTRNLG